jgi:hypothetical protein
VPSLYRKLVSSPNEDESPGGIVDGTNGGTLAQLPIAANVQTPAEPARLQLPQPVLVGSPSTVSQRALQHTPSVQKPLPHCASLVQGPANPSLGAQLPLLQKNPVPHWASLVQLLVQAGLPLQT